MDKILKKDKKTLFGIIILIGLIGYTGFQLVNLSSENLEQKNQIALLEKNLEEKEGELKIYMEANESLNKDLDDEKNKNDLFYDQIKDIAGTVGDLEKLSETDKELLQKYSKVYFLNEHYQPPRLKAIDPKYSADPNKALQVHAEMWPFLEDMIKEATEDGLSIKILSAFRSFGEQSSLKASYSVQYGSGANTFSADQGYSEHQLGTTIDITAESLGNSLSGFQNTPEYEWLLNNAYKFGFVLSYPENNGYYVFEPWHWRFVGEDLARDLHKKEASFYDWDQRDIDEYLIKIFD